MKRLMAKYFAKTTMYCAKQAFFKVIIVNSSPKLKKQKEIA